LPTIEGVHRIVKRLWLCLALLVSLPSPALAQSRAARLISDAKAHYLRNEFREALTRFEQALELDRRPSTILNIAQCHRQIGNLVQALSHLKLYRQEWAAQNPGKPSPYADEVESLIKRISDQLKQQAPKPQPKPVAPATAPAAATQAAPTAIVTATQPAPAPRRTPLYKRWWLWTIVGAVVVGGVVTAVALTTGGDSWTPKGQHYCVDTPPCAQYPQ
jgi:hypothetical protein